jgi:PST family polysaccharide transporter
LTVITRLLKKTIFKDFLSVSFIQGLNYLVPLLLLHYVVRRLGPEYFGLASFSHSFVLYFSLIVNYGFDLSATREVAKATGNVKRQGQIFKEILQVKTFLFVISSILFLIVMALTPKLKEHARLHIVSYLINIGAVLFPMWFFQGINQLKMATIFNFSAKVLMALLVFLFVHNASDYVNYNGALSRAQILLGISSFIYVYKKYTIKLYWIGWLKIRVILKQGFSLFLSMIVINFYTTTNIVLLGFLSNNTATGYFAGTAKVIAVVMTVRLMPLSYILYPKIAHTLHLDKEAGIELLQNTIWIAFGIGLIMSLGLLIFSKWIIIIFFGQSFLPAQTTLILMSALPFLIALSNAFGIQGMLNFKMDKAFLKITSLGAILCVVVNLFVIPVYNQNGAAFAWLFTECFIT